METKQVSENKEAPDKTKMYGEEMPMWVPPGVTTFADLDAYMESQEMAEEMRETTHHFGALAQNVMMSEMVEDKAGSLSTLAKEFAGRVSKSKTKEADDPEAQRETRLIDKFVARVKELLHLDAPPPANDAPFSHIWKEADGQYRWLAAYTNNFRDNDNPPEIISADAHKEFDQALNSGQWPMPEVWLWHYPYKVGETHFHAYDEKSGFCIAGGTMEDWAAEGVIKAKWEGLSHGMPKGEIRRDDEDKSIITRRRTREITFLPTKAAANNLAFHIISKETGMSDEIKEIPAHKREEFVKAFGEERVKQMEAELATRAQQAKDVGTESKEQTQAPEAVAEPPAPAPVNSDVVEAIQALVAEIKTLGAAVKGLDDRVKEIEKSDKEKLTRKAAQLPEASLAAFVKSELFTKANQVSDKGPGPEEKESKQDGSSGLFFNELGWTSPVGMRR